jgi:hypothetical protein
MITTTEPFRRFGIHPAFMCRCGQLRTVGEIVYIVTVNRQRQYRVRCLHCGSMAGTFNIAHRSLTDHERQSAEKIRDNSVLPLFPDGL